jgi:ribosomal protein S18 acetylase RimI-like enzyme
MPKRDVRPLGGGDVTTTITRVLPLVHEAGNPYLDWFFGDPARTRATLEDWMRRETSEYFVDGLKGLFDNGEIEGVYRGLGGAELAVRRKADALTAFKQAGREGRSELAARLEERRGLFPPVDDTEFYLSNIGVLETRRGHGVGGALLEEFVAEGRRLGFTTFRLDVHAGNGPALRLYDSAGFQVVHEHTVASSGMSYRSMVLRDAAVT